MSSEIHHEFLVFTTDAPFEAPKLSLFDEPYMVVFTKSVASNTDPQIPDWSVQFVGSSSDFANQFLPDIQAVFDNGLGRFAGVNAGKSVSKYIRDKAQQAKPLTIAALHRMGFIGWRWWGPLEGVDMTSAPFEGMRAIQHYGTANFVHPFNDNDDIRQCMEQVAALKNQTPAHNTWIGQFSKAAAYQLAKAAYASHLRVLEAELPCV